MRDGATGVGCAGWLALICLAAPVHAAKAGQPFRLEYWADGRCPDAVEFARQIQTRAPRLRLAEGAEPALGFYAELVERAGAATGRLTARSPDGREVVREVRGPTCEDVALALALIAALAADPSQPVEDEPPQAKRTGSPRLRHVPDDLAPQLAEPPGKTERWSFGLGGGVGFESSIAPNPGYGLSIAFEAEGYAGSAFRPLLSLSALRAVGSSSATRGSNASFDWVTFRAAVCPARWPEDTPLFVRPCGFLDAGFLGADVEYGSSSQAQTRPWFALGGFLRTEALVGAVVSFQLDGGITVPLVHGAYSAGDGTPVAFQVPSSGLLGRIGLSYRFQ
ncbi:MAG TPA: hypothetical protein VJV79_25250 [Polyangiaceae bacterium]|nr:hypothetical protein [Polyangiaceae bacterium]